MLMCGVGGAERWMEDGKTGGKGRQKPKLRAGVKGGGVMVVS